MKKTWVHVVGVVLRANGCKFMLIVHSAVDLDDEWGAIENS